LGNKIVSVVAVGEEPRKLPMKKKKRTQIRHAKAHVISMLGEFAYTCCHNQVQPLSFWKKKELA